MATPNIVPRADSEGGLGTASKYWGSAYIDFVYVGAGKMGRDADNLLDFSIDNNIVFKVNGTNELQLNSAEFFPYTSDGLSLGNTGRMWSDLFLASGAVINFDNGNVTLTHTNNKLIFGDSDQLGIGNDADLVMYHDTQDSYITNDTGNLEIKNNADNKDIIFKCHDGSGGTTAYLTLDGGLGYTTVQKDIRFEDNVQLELGTDRDLVIYSDGSNGLISNQIGNLAITNAADDASIVFQCDDGTGGVAAYLTLDGNAARTKFDKHLQANDTVKIFLGSGLDFEMYHNASNTLLQNNAGDLVVINMKQDKDILFQADDGQASDDTVATYFYLDGSSAAHDGSATTALYTNWPDNSRISLGASHDFQMYHTGTQTVISQQGTGNLVIQNTANGADISFSSDNGSGGVTEYFRLDGGDSRVVFSKDVRLQDNNILRFGSGNDLQIVHNGADSTITNIAGNFNFYQNTDGGDIRFYNDNGSGGTTEYLRLDGSSIGITVSAPQGMVFTDGIKAKFGNNDDMEIYHDGSTSAFIHNKIGDLYIKNDEAAHDIYFQCDDGSGGLANYLILDGGEVKTIFSKPIEVGADDAGHDVIFYGATSGRYLHWDESQDRLELRDNVQIAWGNGIDLNIKHDGTNSEIINSTGNLLIINNQDDGDIEFQASTGSAAPETYFYLDGSIGANRFPKNVLWDDNVKALFGGGSGDLQIYHDGSNSHISDTGTGDLIITADNDLTFKDGSGNTMANMNASDSVELYFGNSKKFETAAGGIEVAGTIAGSSFRGVRKVVNSTTSDVATALSGQIYSFDDADGATVTLPDSGAGSYTGTTFEFVIKTTATSNSHKIILSDTTNEKFIGAVATIDTDNDNAATFYTPATSNKAITMNGTTTGITGSRIKITNIAADIWSVEGTILHTGNTATPFTNS